MYKFLSLAFVVLLLFGCTNNQELKQKDQGSFKLLLFNHDEQIDFKVKGSLYRKGYDFDIEPDSYEEIEVTIDGLEDGYHSITYILMKNSDKVPIDYRCLSI